jgi:TolB-like protein
MKMLIKIMCMLSLAALVVTGSSFAGTVYKEYSLDYPHPVTRDYMYRTPRVYQPGDQKHEPASLFDFLGPEKKKTLIPAEAGTELSLRVRELVAELLATSREPVPGELHVAVATFVNLDQLYETSAMGRYLSEQMLHELQRAGVDVVDVRMMPSMKVSQGYGEYILSRDMGELNYVHDVDAVAAGTYTVAHGQIFLNGRLLAAQTGRILSSCSTVFDLDEVSAALLQRSGQPVASPASVRVQSYEDLVER